MSGGAGACNSLVVSDRRFSHWQVEGDYHNTLMNCVLFGAHVLEEDACIDECYNTQNGLYASATSSSVLDLLFKALSCVNLLGKLSAEWIIEKEGTCDRMEDPLMEGICFNIK